MAMAHHNLAVWQRADDLFIEVHRLTRQQFPAYERYELGSQLRRAAYSVPSNLVEGIARQHEGDSIRFFDIARASLSELGYGLHAACRLGYIDPARLNDLERQIRMVSAPLKGLIRRYRVQGTLIKGASVIALWVTMASVSLW